MTRQDVENAIATEAEEAEQCSCYFSYGELLGSSCWALFRARGGFYKLGKCRSRTLLHLKMTRCQLNVQAFYNLLKAADWSASKEHYGVTAHDIKAHFIHEGEYLKLIVSAQSGARCPNGFLEWLLSGRSTDNRIQRRHFQLQELQTSIVQVRYSCYGTLEPFCVCCGDISANIAPTALPYRTDHYIQAYLIDS
jgi:hypothetical protein